jgi:hypothetical protein
LNAEFAPAGLQGALKATDQFPQHQTSEKKKKRSAVPSIGYDSLVPLVLSVDTALLSRGRHAAGATGMKTGRSIVSDDEPAQGRFDA